MTKFCFSFWLNKMPLCINTIYDGEKTAPSTNVAGKSGYLPAEN
jgi:hypothetical protein